MRIKNYKKNVFNESNMWGDFHRLFLARIAHYKLNIIEVQVNHRVRKDGKSNYGCGRIANVLIDLFYLKFVNLNKKNSIYFFGKISILLLFFSFLSTLYMFFIKYKFNISFILTPLPILSIFLFTIAILFFFIGIIVQNQITYGHNSGDYKLFFRIHKKNNN